MNRLPLQNSKHSYSIRATYTDRKKKPYEYFMNLDSITEQSETETSNYSANSNQRPSIRSCTPENIIDNENNGKNIVHIFQPNRHFDLESAQPTRRTPVKHEHDSNNRSHSSNKPKSFIVKPKIVGTDHATSRVRSKTSNSTEEYVRSNTTSSSEIAHLHRKEGKLYKVCRTIFSVNNKEGHAILEDSKFSFYKNGIRKVFLDFSIVDAKCVKDNQKQMFKIMIANCKKSFEFWTTTYDSYEWVYNLEQHINYSLKNKKRINLPIKDSSFYKWERISAKKFLSQADTGDILLFSTSSIGSGVQRILTRSDYDHVAMILRYSDTRIMFFEATSNEVNM